MSGSGRPNKKKEASSSAPASSAQPRATTQRASFAPFPEQHIGRTGAASVTLPAVSGHIEDRPQVLPPGSAKPPTIPRTFPTNPYATTTSQSLSTSSTRPQNIVPATGEAKSTLLGEQGHLMRNLSLAGEDNRAHPSYVTGAEGPTSKGRTQTRLRDASGPQSCLSDSTKTQAVTPATNRESSSPSGRTQHSSVARTGEQFQPYPGRVSQIMPCLSRPGAVRAQASKIGIGIETEFMLKALRPEHIASTREKFAQILAINHNARVAMPNPRMDEDLWRYPPKRTSFHQWALSNDPSLLEKDESWGLEMISPLFVAYPGSSWRSHVEATWKYLEQYYEITGSKDCATHIHISVEGGYSFGEVKRIAQSVLYFEPAFAALVPGERRGEKCDWAKSSWLDSDHLAVEDRSRDQSMAFIDTVTDFYSFLTVMNTEQRYYAWNFRSIEKYYTIEFRQPPASTTVNEALSWAELAMSFIQASIEHGYRAKLRKVPATVGGLRWFLEQSNVPGMNEHRRLEWFWEGKDANTFVQTVARRTMFVTEEEIMERRRKLDKGQIKLSTMTSRAPYWREDK